MRERILREIDRIEDDFDVRVVYACESGSRAWGFPSKDSDYDVRFLYVNKPEWYLSVAKMRDVIERKIVDRLDVNGWDMRKSLRLFRKSNPSLLEWINSPLVYDNRYGVRESMRSIQEKYFSKTATIYHYLHMAKGNFKDYLKADTVWVKKYLYVLRPLLAVMWIEQERGFIPVDFNVMVDRIDIPGDVREATRALIEEKKAGAELGRGKRNRTISKFIEIELDDRLRKNYQYPKPQAPIRELDKLFIGLLESIWGMRVGG